jgi:peptidoglycan/LPS O-acetylase OafA/YrhL
MLAATAVLISHAYPLALGAGAQEPMHNTLGFNLGTLAVLTFFAISGYFILQSFQQRNSISDFFAARFLRIYPGLTVVLLLTAVVLGPILTSLDLGSFFRSTTTTLYVPKNLSLKWLEYNLPGVFAQNPYPLTVNGPLWTLFYEVMCYGMVVIVSVLFCRRERFCLFLLGYASLYLSYKLLRNIDDFPSMRTFDHLEELTYPFVLGMAFFRFIGPNGFRLSFLLTLIFLTGISYESPWFYELFVLTWSYGIFYCGFKRLKVLDTYNLLGDYSYGTYIYAFPIGQVVAATDMACSPLTLIAWSLPATLACAAISWHLIEKRALGQREMLATWIRVHLESTRGRFNEPRS